MKNKLLIVLTTAITAVFFLTAQVGAKELGLKPEKTPGAEATNVAEQRAAGVFGNPNGKPENYKGTIDSVNASNITLVLKDGSSVSVQINDKTRLRVPSMKDATWEILKPGLTVMVQARRLQDDSLVARAILVIPGKPAKIHRVGIVTNYEPGVSISIQARDGKEYTFTIQEDTKILPEKRVDQLVVGARVTIISPRDVSGGEVAAKGIVVHPPKEDD